MIYIGVKEWDTLPTFRPRVQFPSPAPIIQQNYMTDLHEKNCIPCRGGISPFDISEIHKYLKKVDGWDVKKKRKWNLFSRKKFHF